MDNCIAMGTIPRSKIDSMDQYVVNGGWMVHCIATVIDLPSLTFPGITTIILNGYAPKSACELYIIFSNGKTCGSISAIAFGMRLVIVNGITMVSCIAIMIDLQSSTQMVVASGTAMGYCIAIMDRRSLQRMASAYGIAMESRTFSDIDLSFCNAEMRCAAGKKDLIALGTSSLFGVIRCSIMSLICQFGV